MKEMIDVQKRKKSSDYWRIWEDDLIGNYYEDYYRSIDPKQLEIEFNKDFNKLAGALIKLDVNERKVFIDFLAKFIEFYLEQKIDKEIDLSIRKILRF
jgi:hypothetical protein